MNKPISWTSWGHNVYNRFTVSSCQHWTHRPTTYWQKTLSKIPCWPNVLWHDWTRRSIWGNQKSKENEEIAVINWFKALNKYRLKAFAMSLPAPAWWFSVNDKNILRRIPIPPNLKKEEKKESPPPPWRRSSTGSASSKAAPWHEPEEKKRRVDNWRGISSCQIEWHCQKWLFETVEYADSLNKCLRLLDMLWAKHGRQRFRVNRQIHHVAKHGAEFMPVKRNHDIWIHMM